MPAALCFPSRIEEIGVLETASRLDPADPRAPYYLGNLLYDRRRYAAAIAAWSRAARLAPPFPTVHRNLGIAEFNVRGRPDRARTAYRRALRADPTDARLLYEYDQLRKRLGEPGTDRLALLDRHPDLVAHRDDLTIERLTLLNRLGRHDEAIAVLQRRRFHPWEGGEGLVSGQWVAANLGLARDALRTGRARDAIARLEEAMRYPENLGEGRHLLSPANEIQYLLGVAHHAGGSSDDADGWLRLATERQGDPGAPPGEGEYWRALASRELGDEAAAAALLRDLLGAARRRARTPVRIDYFATSLPTLLLFDDDLDERNRIECRFLEGLALGGLGRRAAARRALRDVLVADAGHPAAAIHLAELDRR